MGKRYYEPNPEMKDLCIIPGELVRNDEIGVNEKLAYSLFRNLMDNGVDVHKDEKGYYTGVFYLPVGRVYKAGKRQTYKLIHLMREQGLIETYHKAVGGMQMGINKTRLIKFGD